MREANLDILSNQVYIPSCQLGYMPSKQKTTNSLIRVSARNHAGMILMTALAEHAKGGVYISLSDIARANNLSQGFLEEMAFALKAQGLIQGRKGPGGGYRLAKPASKISAEQILTALEGPIAPVACSGCPSAHGSCASKSLWDFLRSDVSASLKRTSLQQMLIK